MSTQSSFAQGLTRREREPLRIPPGAVLVGVLAFMTVMGAAAGLARLLIGLGGTTALTNSTSWGIWIGFDFGMIAFSGTAFTLAAVVHIFHLHQFHAALRPALLAGLLGYVAVLLLLVLDLGRPDRFYNFLLYFNLHSPLFEISWCVLLYSTVLVVEVSPDILEKLGWPRLRRFMLRIMAPVTVIGVTLSSLHQSTLGTLYLNMVHRISPLWWTPILPVLFFTSAILAGLSMGIVAYRTAVRVKGAPEDHRVVTGLSIGVIGVGLLYLALRVGALVVNGSLARLAWNDGLTLLLLLEVVGGVVVPVSFFSIPALRRNSVVQWVAPALVLGGVLLNRFTITLWSQTSPIAGDQYVPSLMEWLTTAGILSAAGLAWYICVRWLVSFEKGHAQESAK